jgi:hypothetical protein
MTQELTSSISKLAKGIHILSTRKGIKFLPFLVLLCVNIPVYSQMNISGKPGLLYVPSAVETKDGSFIFGYAYNPSKYAFRKNGIHSESTYFINLTILPRLDVNVNLMRMNGDIAEKDKGIGDRQLDLKYLILKEKKYQPAMAIYISAPFGIDNSFTTNALVLTKTFQLSPKLSAELTAGIGSPYYFQREESEKSNSNIFNDLELKNKKDLKYRYLSGPIGGIKLSHNKKAGLMVEWDSQHLNFGAYGILFKRWTIQAGVMNFDQITFGTSYALNLKTLPKRLKKANEN